LPKLTPVDYDPFADEQKGKAEPKLTPVDYDPFAEKPQETPSAIPGPDASLADRVVSTLKAGGKGAYQGLTTELPGMVGKAMEFIGRPSNPLDGVGGAIQLPLPGMPAVTAVTKAVPSVGDFIAEKGKELSGWAEERAKKEPLEQADLYTPEGMVYQATKMLAPSLIPGGIATKAGKIALGVKGLAEAGKVAEATAAAKKAVDIGSAAAAGLFGLSQAQQTKETAEEAGQQPGITPYLTGAIEALGEFLGTKYFAKLLKLDEGGITKPGMKDFLKTLGVEIGTEMGQSGGEAAVEKYSGVRPGADPIKEAIDVIGPTAIMTALTGGLGHIAGQKPQEQEKGAPKGEPGTTEGKEISPADIRVREALEKAAGRPLTDEEWGKLTEAAAAEQNPTEIDEAAHEAATSPLNDIEQPSEAQKKAGNYIKGHATIAGLDVTIENPQGSIRSGVSPEGQPWQTEMQSHYGYFKRSEGKDGDQVDAFIKPGTPKNYDGPVFIVNQIDPKTGKFDEHKVMVGFESQADANIAYHENYEPGWRGMKDIVPLSMDEFKTWLKSGETNKPFAPKIPADLKADLKPSSGEKVPDHITRALQEERPVPLAVSVKTKQLTKDTIQEHISSGAIAATAPIRLTTVDEIRSIIKNNGLSEGKDFEGKAGISAQVVEGGKPVVAYGANDKISAAIVFPESSIEGKGQAPNEVKISQKTNLADLRFVVDGYRELMTAEDLMKIIEGEKAAQKERKTYPKQEAIKAKQKEAKPAEEEKIKVIHHPITEDEKRFDTPEGEDRHDWENKQAFNRAKKLGFTKMEIDSDDWARFELTDDFEVEIPGKKGWASFNHINVAKAPNGEWAADISYVLGNQGGGASPSIWNTDWYADRDTAIKAGIKKLRAAIKGRMKDDLSKTEEADANRILKYLDDLESGKIEPTQSERQKEHNAIQARIDKIAEKLPPVKKGTYMADILGEEEESEFKYHYEIDVDGKPVYVFIKTDGIVASMGSIPMELHVPSKDIITETGYRSDHVNIDALEAPDVEKRLRAYLEDQADKTKLPKKKKFPKQEALKEKQKSKAKQKDIKPGTVGMMLEEGEVVTTVTGRETTPFPSLKFGKGTKRTLALVDRWLVDNAEAEAESRGDEFNLLQFRNMNRKNLSPADKDSAEMYLFDKEAKDDSTRRKGQPGETVVPSEEPQRKEPVKAHAEEAGGAKAETGRDVQAHEKVEGPVANENEVYEKDDPRNEKFMEVVEYRTKKYKAKITLLHIPGEGWISALDQGHLQGTYSGGGSPLMKGDEAFLTREEALAEDLNRLITIQSSFLSGPQPSNATENQIKEAKKAVEWAKAELNKIGKKEGPNEEETQDEAGGFKVGDSVTAVSVFSGGLIGTIKEITDHPEFGLRAKIEWEKKPGFHASESVLPLDRLTKEAKTDEVPEVRSEDVGEQVQTLREEGIEGKQTEINIDEIPADLIVEVTAIREKTGKTVKVKESARRAIADLNASIEQYKKLLECLKS